jgi:hypothetical protein
MHNLLILDDAKLNYIQEPFLTQFVKTYWDKIALVYPVMENDMFFDTNYFETINRGYLPDWLFAIVPDPSHPLNVDWIFLKPRQAHSWNYGNHPATDNFNGGGSTTCLYETLSLIEALAEDDRVAGVCYSIPEFYSDSPPKSFERLYVSDLFHNACHLSTVNRTTFDELLAKTRYEPECEGSETFYRRKLPQTVCLGLYGCSDRTLNMQWKVESMHFSGSWTSTTTELADKVTLALRLAGKSDFVTEVAPRSAFSQWMEPEDSPQSLARDYREPLLIRIDDDVLLCTPQVAKNHYCDAYFLDCKNQSLRRFGLNGHDPTPTLQAWGIHPQDARLKFLFRL